MNPVIPPTFFKDLNLACPTSSKQDYMGLLSRMKSLPSDRMVLKELRRISYEFPEHYLDGDEFIYVARQIQSVYRPDSVTGILDLETIAIIFTLVDSASRKRYIK